MFNIILKQEKRDTGRTTGSNFIFLFVYVESGFKIVKIILDNIFLMIGKSLIEV